MASEKSAEFGELLSKASGRGKPGEEPPIPQDIPREEINADSAIKYVFGDAMGFEVKGITPKVVIGG